MGTLRKPLPRTLTLRNGVELPSVGLGTFRAQDDDARNAVVSALRLGLRHIDTASIYKVTLPGDLRDCEEALKKCLVVVRRHRGTAETENRPVGHPSCYDAASI
ncbi:hypothetical protein Vafri_11842 [Volvox africanus]|uniref:NADP-dependent oxidoreductase domain-containing protein n=1 Tax=Volvox africanus TaxID=51714 RepID=A0A8J4F3U6_9CHLO|nr:hypothetical protein Vafri_11842 [Volvox africanus]